MSQFLDEPLFALVPLAITILLFLLGIILSNKMIKRNTNAILENLRISDRNQDEFLRFINVLNAKNEQMLPEIRYILERK